MRHKRGQPFLNLGMLRVKPKSKKIVKLTALAGAMVTALGVSQVAQASVDLGNSAVNISPNGTYNGSNSVGQNSIVVGYQNTANNEWGTTALGLTTQQLQRSISCR